MTEFLIQHQKLLDRFNFATENLRQAMRDKTRQKIKTEYWRKQVDHLTALLEQGKAD